MPFDNDERDDLRKKVMGMGDTSLKKSYYAQLQEKVTSLENIRVELESAIRTAVTNEELFKTLFNTARDGILLIDIDSKEFKLKNRAYVEMVDDPFDNSLTAFYSSYTTDEIDNILEIFDQFVRGDTSLKRNIPLHKRNGDTIYVDVTGSMLQADGKDYLLCILRDMTAERRLAVEKADFESRLNQSQKMETIGALAGGIAHDFNNIIGAIMGLSELSLERYQPDDQLRANLESIMKSCLRARDIVSQLLALSYKTDSKRELIHLGPAIRDAVKLARASIPSSIAISSDLSAENDTVIADQTQICQIILNLCTNASHAITSPNGSIRIRATNESLSSPLRAFHNDIAVGSYFMIEVSDTGSGIDPSIMDRIFESFFTTKAKGKGTGLGLSVIRGIVEKHEGGIVVESELGKGTTFRVYLPLARRKPDNVIQAGSEEQKSGEASVLLIDDEDLILRISRHILTSLGYHVSSFTNGNDAIDHFKNDPDGIDLVLTDMSMPGLTGIDVAEQINRIRGGTPVILCSGFSDEEMETRAYKAGVSE
ncbi:MAG TPA: ATP-binding protein, partial [Spirochaetota bacterium]|nr:ATP-binding protein [Spirochaetota bacterium]